MLIALLLAGLTLFAGCSEDDPVPKMPKTSAAAPTPSPTTSPTPQSEADEAEALIRQWAELGVEMQNTGKTAAYLAITSDECVSCKRVAKSIEQLYAAGGEIELPGKRILDVRKSRRYTGRGVYEVRLLAEPSRYRESPTAPWQQFEGGETTNDVTVTREGRKLVIREIYGS
ncbi:MAG: hypothetical protein H0X12_16205 [Nocardioides sp.]|nr:hypothetical protein [Nocardioides sp.]